MPDAYAALRALSFQTVANALGIDLSALKTRKNGTEWFGPCSIHGSQKNQTCFSYNLDGRYQCFSCNAKGKGPIDLTMALKQCGFKEAVAFLEPLVAVQAAQQPANKKSPNSGQIIASDELKPFTGKYDKYAVPCDWLEKRIPDEEIRKRYGVFCYNNPARKSAYSGRVMLPVRDTEGTLYGYLGRNIASDESDSAPKYLFPPNLPKSRFLFGAHELDTFGQLPLRVIYLVESPFCVMKFAMYGLPAVSPFGWSVSQEQADILSTIAKGLVYLPDRNKHQDIQQSLWLIGQRCWVRFPPLPPGCDDPEYLTKEQLLALTH